MDSRIKKYDSSVLIILVGLKEDLIYDINTLQKLTDRNQHVITDFEAEDVR